MNDTAVRIEDLLALRHDDWVRLAATEYERFVTQLEDLDQDDWQRATVCSEWTVRDVAGHVLGMM